MTPNEVKELCEKVLPMGQKEAQEYLKQFGLNPKNADMLRHLLGTTKTRPDPYSKELRDECRRLVEDEGWSVPNVAKKYGIWTTTVYDWVYRDGWDVVNGRNFWTERKIRMLINEVKKGTSRKDIAMMLECNTRAVNNMYNRLNNGYHVKKWLPLIDKLGLKKNDSLHT